MSPPQPPRRGLRRSRIPAGRIERLARMGWMAGEVALGGLAESARRLVGASSEVASIFATATNAERFARRLSGMRGAAMKLGQMLSLEGDDILPPEVAAALAILRADADAMPEVQLRRVLGHAYGKGWERRFSHFGMEPIAAASIGQVHYAVTADGRELALKIQYPGVAKSIESDVDNLAAMLRLSRLLPGEIDMSGIIAETKRQLRQEADYRAEAEYLRRYAELLATDAAFVVPRVHDDLTTAHILAMDYVAGEPLDRVRNGTQALRDHVGRVLYRLFFREFFEFRFMQTDPNFANYLLLPDGRRIGLLDLGAAHIIPARLSGLYAEVLQAAVAGDRQAMRRVMLTIGFFDADERDDRVEGLIDLFLLGCEPFRHRGAYDFGASDLAARARAIGMDLTFKKGFLRPPPPQVIFLHRKLGGMFLLCARLRARVDVRALLVPILEDARRESLVQ